MALVEDDFNMFDEVGGSDGELAEEEVGGEVAEDDAGGLQRDAMQLHHYSRLVAYCERPEEDEEGHYDVNQLIDRVEAAIEESPDDIFLRKVLQQFGWVDNGEQE